MSEGRNLKDRNRVRVRDSFRVMIGILWGFRRRGKLREGV